MKAQYQDRFFRSIRNYFRAEYTGRYFGIILAELARSEPDAFAAIIRKAGIKLPKQHMQSLSAGELTIDLEWCFLDKKRRADLALYLDREYPILLIEIKDEDGLTKSNAAQLKDYVLFVEKANGRKSTREHHCHFLLLSRYIPRDDDALQIEIAKTKKLPVRQLLHGQIHKILAGKGDSVARMLSEYLEDVGMTYRDDIDLNNKDRKTVHYMFNRLLGMSSLEGLGGLAGAPTIEAIPRLMETFFGNLAVLGNWVYAPNSEVLGNRFRRNLYIHPDYNIPKNAFSEKLTTAEKIDAVKQKLSVIGGFVVLYAVGSLRCPKGMWATVQFGYCCTIEKKRKPELNIYVQFDFPGSEKVPERVPIASSPAFSKFPDETTAERLLRSCFREAKQDALKVGPPALQKNYKRLSSPINRIGHHVTRRPKKGIARLWDPLPPVKAGDRAAR